jgi:hypothetical protein
MGPKRCWNRIILDAISRYYNLPFLGIHRDFPGFDMAEAAWKHLNGGINFQNISADALAFVYKNTFVTPETRKQFGTHSTPWQVAEYIVGRVGIENHSPKDITIYEPCAGAAVFLVSALRHLKEMLPVEWTTRGRPRGGGSVRRRRHHVGCRGAAAELVEAWERPIGRSG